MRAMIRSSGCAVLILIGLWAGSVTGCGKKAASGAATEATAADVAKKLPGANEVTAALEKKDYDGAMAALLRVQQTVATEDQRVQFIALSREVKDKLLEASATDPKATEALTALRAMTMGR